jgi:acetyl-CoA carboxylase biotin carboxylase subunit
MFRKVLVANRGEIAVRIIRALRELEIPSVATFSEADRLALHVQMADEAVCIGPPPSTDSYLRGDRILEAAEKTGATAIHPGYGFLSENARFARDCEQAGVKFIGPSWIAIEQMGSKTAARRIAATAGAPIVPGTEQGLASVAEARGIAKELGYPVLLKAAAGGGGKGMRRVDAECDLESAFQAAASEAERAFGSGEVYIEKLIERPRHIEIQILGDEHGQTIHLGERECSIQRRHQKVVEECPSPLVAAQPELRHKMGQAALKIARAVHYSNAGTMEFLADQNGEFYFLEMNTRLQVEHPVTELATGLDLVHWQIRIAAGERLTVMQEDVRWYGSAIECRIYAEDPENNYLPSPGRIAEYVEPSGPGVRIDAGVFPGWTVPMEYDPLLAKLSVWASDRGMAIERMRRAIEEYRVLGIATNLQLFGEILRDPRFRNGELDTGFLEKLKARPGGDDRLRNPRKTAALSSAHREESAGAFADSGRASAASGLERLAVAAVAASRHTALAEPPQPTAATSLWRDRARKDLLR